MRRIYFLVPTLDLTRTLVDELLLARVEERHIHLIAKDEQQMDDLPTASVLQRTDLIPALEKGLTIGGATGAIAGLVAVTVPPAGLVLGGGAVLGITLAGAGVGAWAASMIGAGAPNSQLRRFEQAIDQGQILMMVDVPKRRVEEIEELIRSHHPEVRIRGTEPTIPAFP
ncbi:MAG: ammonium transporter [Ectothiorhodospiraceae bacterium]|nr:ammonium transporter [Ectothiorhodospiraceae bacterium]